MSEDENPKDLQNGEKSERKGGRHELMSVVDVMNRARSHQCGGKKK